MRAPIDDAVIRAVIEGAPDCILLTGDNGNIEYANQRVSEVFGYAPAELLGQPIEMLVPTDRRAAHRKHRGQFLAQPETRPMGALALHGLRKDGSQVHVEISLSHLQCGQRHYNLAFVRDATRLKRAEAIVAETHGHSMAAALSGIALGGASLTELADAALTRLAATIDVWGAEFLQASPADGRPMVVAAHAPAGRIVQGEYAKGEHPVAERLMVVGGGEAVEIDVRQLPPGLVNAGVGSGLMVALSGTKARYGALCLYRIKGHAFTTLEADMLKTAAGVIVLGEDRARTEVQLVQMQKMDALGQLTSGVAHDFSNLLMVINGNLQLLEDEICELPRIASLVHSAADAGNRGAMLSRKLLTFARRQPMQPRPLDLNAHVSSLLDILQRTLGENIKLEAALDRTLPLINADVSQFDTSLMNLAINARDAMPAGGVLVIASRRVAFDEAAAAIQDLAAGDYILVSVSDTGHGMPPDIVARAFEPFFTTKEAGKGSGLGLSMVLGFARQAGGTVRIHSEPGQGTTVRMYLPSPPVAEEPRPLHGTAQVPRGSETILVVEDETQVMQVATAFLASLGYRVLQAGDGVAATLILAEHPETRLLFTDVVLPGIDGIALAEAMRIRKPDLAILLTTGYASVEAIATTTAISRPPLLQKPYTREELAVAIRQALDADHAAKAPRPSPANA